LNITFDNALELGAEDGLKWLTAKWRAYAVDMDDAGPTPGAWKLSSIFSNGTGIICTTVEDHELVVGDKVSLFGTTGIPQTWQATTYYPVGAIVGKGGVSNGKRYRTVVPGTTPEFAPTTWPTVDGTYVFSGTAVFITDGSDTNSPVNGNWTVDTVPSTDEFTIDPFPGTRGAPDVYGYVANLSKTYLSEFAPAAARTAMSDPLSSKQILAGSVLDCADATIDLTGADSSEVLVVARAALLNADPDLPDTQQRLFLYYDTMEGLPIAANAGNVSLGISNTPDRLVKL
jgi:hypothetical protein